MDVHRARLHEAIATPHDVEELVAAEDATGSPGQHRQQLELLGRELHGTPLHPHLEAVSIDLELAGLDQKALGILLDDDATARDGADAGDQLTW